MIMAHGLFQDVADSLELISADAFSRVVSALVEAAERGGRVYVMGNGGSASTASHLVCDLTKHARPAHASPFRAFALTDNIAVLTAWANDTEFDRVFERQLVVLAEPGDVVVAISTSGRSPNILAGLRAARERGALTIGLLGLDNSDATELVDVALHVGSPDAGVVETAHLAVAHALVVAIGSALRAGSSDGTATLAGRDRGLSS
jgi:D-sedoheptulose 7-phosphate isomerase